MWVFALTAAAGASAIGAWIFDRWRGRARNHRGACGACGALWADASATDRYLIHGRLVCEECARKARRRMPWELAALAAWAALLTGIAFGNLAAGNALGFGVLSIVASAIVVPLGAMHAMKLANRRSQERLARGELSDHGRLSDEGIEEAPSVLAEGASSDAAGRAS